MIFYRSKGHEGVKKMPHIRIPVAKEFRKHKRELIPELVRLTFGKRVPGIVLFKERECDGLVISACPYYIDISMFYVDVLKIQVS